MPSHSEQLESAEQNESMHTKAVLILQACTASLANGIGLCGEETEQAAHLAQVIEAHNAHYTVLVHAYELAENCAFHALVLSALLNAAAAAPTAPQEAREAQARLNRAHAAFATVVAANNARITQAQKRERAAYVEREEAQTALLEALRVWA